jgi:hypothetical protein
VSIASSRSAHALLRSHTGLTTALITLAGCATAAALLASDVLGSGPGPFAASVGVVVLVMAVTGFSVYGRMGASARLVAISPFAIASATWTALFVLRPVELYVFPDHAVLALGQLGFDSAALMHAVALAGVGCAAWCAGYVWTLGRIDETAAQPVGPLRTSWVGGAVALVIGTALWVALFVRLGGIGALVHSAVSVRADQRSSSYGFVGVWLVQGTGLCALALLFERGRRNATSLRTLVVLAAALSAAAAVALELRGLALFAVISALTIALALRPPTKAKLLVGTAAAVLAVLGLGFAQQVRAYTSRMSTPEAARTAVHTPAWAFYASDLGTFDDLVAMRELVPASLPFVNGATIREIPQALVPRRLWPEKPVGVDARVASYLYPGVAVAVPISLQGELYWNGGLAVLIGGSLVIGAAFGALGRFGLRARNRTPFFVLYAVALPFTHAFLTRGLAAMTENLIFALVGVSVAGIAFGFRSDSQALLRPLRALRIRMPFPQPERRGADA